MAERARAEALEVGRTQKLGEKHLPRQIVVTGMMTPMRPFLDRFKIKMVSRRRTGEEMRTEERTAAFLTFLVDQGSEAILRKHDLMICYKFSESTNAFNQ